VVIVKGHTSKDKMVRINDLDFKEALDRLKIKGLI
jgi:uncharacterized protein YggU (UPF0235/DUF167 family)